MRLFNIAAIAAGALAAAAVAAILWRAAAEGEFDYGDRGILITADYVAQCQTMTETCIAATDGAVAHSRAACRAQRPGRHAVARGALIWLNAHPQLHPLPVEDGIARAMDAIWPCGKS